MILHGNLWAYVNSLSHAARASSLREGAFWRRKEHKGTVLCALPACRKMRMKKPPGWAVVGQAFIIISALLFCIVPDGIRIILLGL